MNDEILNSNKIPGSPGCDSFTRPEEISALSKFLGTKRKIMEENTQLDNSLEPVPGITTGKFPIIDKLPDTAENIDLSREEVSLSDKLISLDKNSSNFEKEINNLPDNYIGLDNENNNISLSDKILKIALENDINLEEKVDKLEVSDDIELSNNKLDLDITDDIELKEDRLDLHIIDDIELSSSKLDLDITDGIELSNSKLDLDITDDIELNEDKLDLDITDDIELSDSKLDLDITDDIELSDNIIDLSILDDIELSDSILELDYSDEINLSNKKINIEHKDKSKLSEERLSLLIDSNIDLDNFLDSLFIGNDSEIDSLSDTRLDINKIDKVISLETIIDEISNAISPENQTDYKYLDNTKNSDISENILNTDHINLGDAISPENQTDYSYGEKPEEVFYELINLENKANLLSGEIHDWFNNIGSDNKSSKINSSNSTNYVSNAEGISNNTELENFNKTRAIQDNSFNLPLSANVDITIDGRTIQDREYINNSNRLDSDRNRLDNNKNGIADDYDNLLEFNKSRSKTLGVEDDKNAYNLPNSKEVDNPEEINEYSYFNIIGTSAIGEISEFNKTRAIQDNSFNLPLSSDVDITIDGRTIQDREYINNSDRLDSDRNRLDNNKNGIADDYDNLLEFNKSRSKTLGVEDNKNAYNLPISANVDITIDGRTIQDREYIDNSNRLSNSIADDYDNLLEFNKSRSKTLGVEDDKNAFNLPNSKEVDSPEEINEYSYNTLNNVLHLKFGSDGETRLDKVGKYDKNGNPIGNNIADDYDNLLEFNKSRSNDAFERPIARDTKVSQNDKYIPLENLKLLHEKDQNKNYKKSEYIKKIKDSLPTASEDEIFNMIMDFDEYIWSPITESDGDGNKIGGTKTKGYESGINLESYEQKIKDNNNTTYSTESRPIEKQEWIAKIKALVCAYLGASNKLSDQDKVDLKENNVDNYIESVNNTMKNIFTLNNNQPLAKNVESTNKEYSYDTLNNILHLKFGSDGKTRLDNIGAFDRDGNPIGNNTADDYDNLLEFNKSRSKTLGAEDKINAYNLPIAKEVDNPEETSEYSYFNTIGTSTIGEISEFNKVRANQDNSFELPQDYDKSFSSLLPIEKYEDEDNIYIKNKGSFKSKDFDNLVKSNDRGYSDEIPYYKLPDQSFSLDKNYAIGNYLRFAAEEIFGSWSRNLEMKKARKVLLEETLALLIWGRDELEKLTKAIKYRLPGDDFGLLSDLVSGGSTKDLAKSALNSVSDALSKETPNPINRPVWDKDKDSTKTIGWEEANSRPSVIATDTEKEDKSFWKKLGNNLVGTIGKDPNDNRKYKFIEQYLTAGEGIKTTLFDFAGLGKLPEDKGTVESFYDLLKTSPYFTTSNKITTTGSGYKVITLDSNIHWEIIFEPYIGELNGNYTFLPAINEINLRNEALHGVKTSYNYWIPINSFELQKEKLNTKSLGLFDGEIVYPISMDFVNEFRMTIVDDQYKSWRNYFERCVQASVYNSTPVGKNGAYIVEKNGSIREVRNKHGVLLSSTTEDNVTESENSSIVIDRNFHLVAPYKNLSFRCRIYVMTPQLSIINKYDLLLILKDFSEERSGEIDSSGSDLNLSFSIVGENPPEIATELSEIVAKQVEAAEKQIEDYRNALKEKEDDNWAANLATGITNTVLEILG